MINLPEFIYCTNKQGLDSPIIQHAKEEGFQRRFQFLILIIQKHLGQNFSRIICVSKITRATFNRLTTQFS